MKPQAYLAAATWLATSASAIGGGIPGMGSPPKRPDGKPTPIENWKWTNPFATKRITKFNAVCSSEKTFHANEFLLDDLSEGEPLGLIAYREPLKKIFSDREYPGSWDGIDPHGYDRNLLVMKYSDVPIAVREWIEDKERTDGSLLKGLFAVYDRATKDSRPKDTVVVAATPSPIPESDRKVDEERVVIFAPGALYETLPLWVAEGSGCDAYLLNTSKYTPKPEADGAVVAYPIRKTRAKRRAHRREMEFTIKADLLQLKAGAKFDDVEEIDAPKAKAKVEKKEAPKVEEKPKTEEKPVVKEEEKAAADKEKKPATSEKEEL